MEPLARHLALHRAENRGTHILCGVVFKYCLQTYGSVNITPYLRTIGGMGEAAAMRDHKEPTSTLATIRRNPRTPSAYQRPEAYLGLYHVEWSRPRVVPARSS